MERRNVKRLLQAGVATIFIVTIVIYSYTKAQNLMAGPSVDVISPTNGHVATSSAIILQGISSNINAIQLNDHPIFIDEQGNFAEIVILAEGYNALRLNAKDKFGREVKKVVEYLYKPAL